MAERSNPSRRLWLAKVALLVGSVLLTLLLAEAMVRVVVPPLAGASGHQPHIVQHDELLGWTKIPNAEARIKTNEYDVVVRLNSRGLRGPLRSYGESDAHRIMVIGDSFVEGYTVEEDGLVTRVLERELATKTTEAVEVIGAGTRGWATDQELLFFRSEGKKYDPDVTVLMFFDNDIWFNTSTSQADGNKPRFVLDDSGQLQLRNVPVPQPRLEEGADAHPPGIKGWLAENSRLYVNVRDALKSNLALHNALVNLHIMDAPPEGSGGEEDDPYSSLKLVPMEFRVYEQGGTHPEIETAWDVTGALLSQMKREVEAAGSEFLVFYIPSAFVVGKEDAERWNRQFNGMLDPERVRSDLIKVCEERDIPLLDPTAAFRAEHQDGNGRLYFEQDVHWNEAGHRLAAALLAEWISEKYLE